MNTSETLFSSAVIQWNNCDNDIGNLKSVSTFKKQVINLSDQFPIIRLMCIILMDLNYWQDYEFL